MTTTRPPAPTPADDGGPRPGDTGAIAAVLAAAYRDDGSIDLAALLSVLHPDVALHVPGAQPLAGTHQGLDAIARFAVALRDLTVDGEHTERVDTLVGDDHVALVVHVAAERADGRRLDNHTVHLARVDATGLVRDIWFHNRDQAHVDGFWS
ncbi:MAG: nuclear transport factor 2 family protein [Ilumatobacteraceae bacterium]